jgi:hypothetical protein
MYLHYLHFSVISGTTTEAKYFFAAESIDLHTNHINMKKTNLVSSIINEINIRMIFKMNYFYSK